jgi:hypothetical protein
MLLFVWREGRVWGGTPAKGRHSLNPPYSSHVLQNVLQLLCLYYYCYASQNPQNTNGTTSLYHARFLARAARVAGPRVDAATPLLP